MSDSDNKGNPGSVFSLTPSFPEIDSILMVQSQVVLQELKENKSSETVIDEIMELITEPSGSQLLRENEKTSTPRVGVSIQNQRYLILECTPMMRWLILNLIFLLWRLILNFLLK